MGAPLFALERFLVYSAISNSKILHGKFYTTTN